MKQTFLLPLLLLLISASAFAQTEIADAPVVWEKYRIGRYELSVDLPKMPVRVGSQDLCSFFTRTSFFSYADEAVYEITVVERSDLPMPVNCRERRVFSDSTLTARLGEIRSGKPDMAESNSTLGERQAYRFAGEQNGAAYVRWLIPDMAKDRWIELAVVRRNDKKSLEESFVRSLDLTRAAGKEVGRGAPVMLGDQGQPAETAAAAKVTTAPPYDSSAVGPGKVPVADPFLILAKPKAQYTEEARRAGVQGAVRLKVTLLSTGSVGDIALVSDLPKGLTGEALAAARKLVFLPARVDGAAVTKVVTIEYNFAMY
jgi:TonB family protein